MFLDYDEFNENFPDEQILNLDVTDFEVLNQKLPTTSLENLNAKGQRKPMQPYQANALYRTPLDIKKFQKIASTYYKTNRIGDIITLVNEVNSNWIRFSFNADLLGYIKIYSSRTNSDFLTKLPSYNNDLFKKIVRHKLL